MDLPTEYRREDILVVVKPIEAIITDSHVRNMSLKSKARYKSLGQWDITHLFQQFNLVL